MTTLSKLLHATPSYILAIDRDSELSYASDDLAGHYLAELSKQYEYGKACIMFTSECLVSINDKGRVTIEQFDTSPDAHYSHYNNISDLDAYCYDELCDLHNDHIVYDTPDFMMVEYY